MKRFFLLLGDIFILYLSLYLTLFLRYGADFNSQILIHLLPFSLLFIFWLIVFYIAGLYELNSTKNSPEFYSSLFTSIAVSAAVSVLFFYLIPNVQIAPRRNLLIYAAAFTGLISLWRWLYNRILGRTFRNNTIIVGFNQLAYDLAKFLNLNPQYGYNLKYALDVSQEAAFSFESTDFRKVRGSRDIEKIIENDRINTIILSPESYRLSDIIDVFYKASKRKIKFINLATAYEEILKKVPLEAVNQLWFLENISRAEKRLYELLKRMSDLILALIGGAMLLILFPFIGLPIKFSSPGPVFYRQKRIGKGGKAFEVIKFRTMRTRELPEDAIAAAERLIDCDYYGFIGTHPLEACVLARYDYPNQKPPVWYVPGRVNGYLGQSGLDPEHADSRNPIPVELSFATEGRFLWEEAANSEQKHIARRVLEELGNPIRKLP